MTVAMLPACEATSKPTVNESSANCGRKIRTLIVDDQSFEREVMRRTLKNEPDIEVVGICKNGREALEAIKTLNPDLVFLDVQMPELDGFGVVSKLDPARMPAIIFVTANEEFALKAFDVHALDYLLKPCARDRFQVALQRARQRIHSRQNGVNSEKPAHNSDRLAVKSSGRILFLQLTGIDWMEAADNYVNIHVGEESHPIRETMTAIEERLPADRFLRISRSTIVNIGHIKELRPLCHGEYQVLLQNGARLNLTRGYRDKLQLLGL